MRIEQAMQGNRVDGLSNKRLKALCKRVFEMDVPEERKRLILSIMDGVKINKDNACKVLSSLENISGIVDVRVEDVTNDFIRLYEKTAID